MTPTYLRPDMKKPAPKPPPVPPDDHATHVKMAAEVYLKGICPTCGTLTKIGATCEVDGTVVR